MRKRKTPTMKDVDAAPFERIGPSHYTRLFDDMLLSPAYMSLSKGQKALYTYIKMQRKNSKRPEADFDKTVDWVQGDDVFYFSLPMAVAYRLYKQTGAKEFYHDMKVLEDHGFIKKIVSGQKAKKQNIYRYSDAWKDWGKNLKTV